MRPEDLVTLFMRQMVDDSQNEELWAIYHSVTFTERVVKRWAFQHSDSSQFVTEPVHPLVKHMKWIITPILQVSFFLIFCMSVS